MTRVGYLMNMPMRRANILLSLEIHLAMMMPLLMMMLMNKRPQSCVEQLPIHLFELIVTLSIAILELIHRARVPTLMMRLLLLLHLLLVHLIEVQMNLMLHSSCEFFADGLHSDSELIEVCTVHSLIHKVYR